MKRIGLALLLVLLLATPSWAAVKYWVGGGTNTNWTSSPVTNWGSASGVRDNVTVPGAADDVIFDNSTNGTTLSNLTAAITVNSLNMSNWNSTLWHNTVTLTIDSNDSTGLSLYLSPDMTYTMSAVTTSAITFTGAGLSKITTNGKAIGKLSMSNAGDTFQLQDDLSMGGSLTLTAGTFDTNNKTVTLTGNAPDINGAITFYNLTRIGNAVKTDTLRLFSTTTVTGTLNLSGNSNINRLFVYGDTFGTQRSINVTGATVLVTNTDFRDINFINTTMPVVLSAIVGGSGNAGGNTNITFTTSDDWYWQTTGAGTYNMENNTYWFTATNGTGTRMDSDARNAKALLPQDNAFFDADSITGATTIDQNELRICHNLDFTGTDAVTFHSNTYASGTAQTFYGSVTFTPSVTWYQTVMDLTFEGSGADNFDPQVPAGGIRAYLTISKIGGSLTMLSSFRQTNAGDAWRNLKLNYGTFDLNDFDHNFTSLSSSNSNVRAMNLGSGTLNFYTGNDAYTWETSTSANFNLSAENSTIRIQAINKGFRGGSLTFNNLSVITPSSGAMSAATITGNNTFSTLAIATAGNITCNFTAGSIQNVTSFIAAGTVAAPIILQSTTSALAYLNDTTGTNTVYNCTINNLPAAGGASWYAYANCTVDANSTGWILTAPGGAVDDSQVIMVY